MCIISWFRSLSAFALAGKIASNNANSTVLRVIIRDNVRQWTVRIVFRECVTLSSTYNPTSYIYRFPLPNRFLSDRNFEINSTSAHESACCLFPLRLGSDEQCKVTVPASKYCCHFSRRVRGDSLYGNYRMYFLHWFRTKNTPMPDACQGILECFGRLLHFVRKEMWALGMRYEHWHITDHELIQK